MARILNIISNIEKLAGELIENIISDDEIINKYTISENTTRDFFILSQLKFKNYNKYLEKEELLKFYNKEENKEVLNINDDDFNDSIKLQDFYDDLVYKTFKKEFENFIKNTFNLKIKNKIKEDENLKKISSIIKSDILEELSIKNLFYMYKEFHLNYNEKYFKESIKALENIGLKVKDKNIKNYQYVTLVKRDIVRTKENKSFNFHDYGSIQCFYNVKTKTLLPDLNTINFKQSIQWSKSKIKDPKKIITESNVDYMKYNILDYIENSFPIMIKKYKLKDILKADIKLENLLKPLPNNKIESLSFLDLVSEEIIFSIIKYLKNGSVIEDLISIKEVGDFRVVFNDSKNKEIKSIFDFLYLDTFKEEKLYKTKDLLLLEDSKGRSYNDVIDIPELHIYKTEYKSLVLLPKKKKFKKDILRINFIINTNDDKTFKKIKKDYDILYLEELLFNPNSNLLEDFLQFNKVEDMTTEKIKEIYDNIIKNIPEEIINKIEVLNNEVRKNLVMNQTINYSYK